MLPSVLFSICCFLVAATGQPFASSARHADRLAARDDSSLQVDLGYSIYQGYNNATSGLNIFKGMRYAEPPLARLRWQPPQAPAVKRNKTLTANEYSLQCPQSLMGTDGLYAPSNETDVSEDCLFLNVWAPSHAPGKLPVMLWIHGGGYGMGNGRYDFTDLINTNNYSFIGVSIQYRLGAFGFLSSDEVHRKGVPNAGLLDQRLALEWVQQYIHLFNGDAARVTLAGESAGAGSVMLHGLAYGGSLETRLFQNTFGASPYLPPQYGYKDWIPSQAYYAFASAAGCDTKDPYLHNGSLPLFECLQGKDSRTLINASMTVSAAGSYGTWAFAPVIDGILVQRQSSVQLAEGKVNGVNGLFGNNANEGFLFVPQVLKTEKLLVEYLKLTFPLFSEANISAVLEMYPFSDPPENHNESLFATNGVSGPTAIDQSSLATGQQQRANLIYGEATFVCPSYWLAQAYSNKHPSCSPDGYGYKYQFSVPPSAHSSDLGAYFPNVPGIGGMAHQSFPSDFSTAFQTLIGNFVVKSNPSISSLVANGVLTGNTSTNSISDWPAYGVGRPVQVDLNTTCLTYTPGNIKKLQLPYCKGGENRLSLVDAASWEGGRGRRCEFWREVGRFVPE